MPNIPESTICAHWAWCRLLVGDAYSLAIESSRAYLMLICQLKSDVCSRCTRAKSIAEVTAVKSRFPFINSLESKGPLLMANRLSVGALTETPRLSMVVMHPSLTKIRSIMYILRIYEMLRISSAWSRYLMRGLLVAVELPLYHTYLPRRS